MGNDHLDDSMARREAEQRKLRVGFVLFAVYIVGYTLFTLAGTFFKGILIMRFGGVNVGITSGMAIIVSAILIAILYNWYAGKMEEQ